ncbi:hypothetical protein Fleli_1841 [Bernardetia litoralis DSM 6794]|uniref:Uncharacterized protein n=1 Tax=Bernardetia litoralis (strain ATCC 23117 / DSM 6794 / NBRC 15988 / NCIMB 1366 / Fx l1 / Sio-4) TaxID=880071 RepID=I4AJV4_BERLS|nr:hypothetical protein [Bernardetia litoralis]AFM04239.1 hypothetical protein Fleli_1841 [Bernardetia litoralis DSM 6794]
MALEDPNAPENGGSGSVVPTNTGVNRIEKTSVNKLQDFIKYVEERVVDLTNLEIKTIVGDFDVDVNEKVSLRRDHDYKLMNSRINLIDGDITTHISRELVSDEYEWMRNFHAHKEEKGHEIIQGNIQAIASLIDLFREIDSDK